MTDGKDEVTGMLQSIRENIEKLEEVWERVEEIASRERETESETDGKGLAMKLSSIRETIDQVEIKLDSLEQSISNIESMRFILRNEP